MLNYQLQESISKVVTGIMEREEWKRGLRRQLEVELNISNIKENSFEFDASNGFNEEVVKTYELHGTYSQSQVGFKFKFVAERNEKPVVVTYTVYINEDSEVVCVPDEYENAVNDVKAEKLYFDKNGEEDLLSELFNCKIKDGKVYQG